MSISPQKIFRRRSIYGYKGAVLFLVGASFITRAFAIAFAGWWALPQLPGAFEVLPTPARFAAWFIPGVLAVVAAFRPRLHGLGFAAAAAPLFGAAGLWACAFVWRVAAAALWGNVSGSNVFGTAVSATQYVFAALVLATCARWPDPRVPLRGADRE